MGDAGQRRGAWWSQAAAAGAHRRPFSDSGRSPRPAVGPGLSRGELGELPRRSRVERAGVLAAATGKKTEMRFGVSGFPKRSEANAFPSVTKGPENRIVGVPLWEVYGPKEEIG